MTLRPASPNGVHAAAICLFLAAPLLAHGGQYRGPSSIAPPGNSTSPDTSNNRTNGSTVTGSSPSAPASPSGGTGAAGAGGAMGASSGRAAPRGYMVGDDLGRWEFWWEFGKDPYLRLRDTLYSDRSDDPLARWNPRLATVKRRATPPTAKDVTDVAVLVAQTLADSKDRDTSSACILALAKIGPTRAGFDLTELLTPFLARGDQELRESAALSLGISGSVDQATVQILTDLIQDNSAGRKLSGHGAVNERTRAFAAFGAGLLLDRSREAGASMRLTRPLQNVLAQSSKHGRNLVVAAIEALALFPSDWQGAAANTLRSGIVEELGSFYEQNLGAGQQLVQAHVPTALARILRARSMAGIKWRDRFAKDLALGLRSSSGSNTKVNHHIAQSCALALGSMCKPWETENSPSNASGELLIRVHKEHRDQQTRSFAALALARMGGKMSMGYLLSELSQANKALEQPWLAMALGVIAAKQRAEGTHRGNQAADYERVTKSLLQQFKKARNPGTIGALAIALGLTGTGEARDALRETMVKNQKRDGIAGYVALGLGLLQDTSAVNDLRQLREQSARRPFVLMQSVRALGLLGDYTLTEQLSAELSEPGSTLMRLSATASALAQIGDRRCLPALRSLVNNPDVTPLAQAFAVVALGGVCDKDPLPWNAIYANQVNYRASTETLTDGRAGLLDLL